MEFINGAALWGAALMAVPIIIHLITRRRALRKPFAAIKFVLDSYRKMRRRLRLKRILILLARMAAVIILAMLISRPTVPAGAGEMNMGMGSRSLVILIDNSMSMTQGEPGNTPFERAKTTAKAVIESIGPGQEAALMAVDMNAVDEESEVSAWRGLQGDPKPLLKGLESIRISWAYRPAPPALKEALELAGGGGRSLKQVLFITDLQKSAWSAPEELSAAAALLILDVGPRKSLSNAAIRDVSLKPVAGEPRYKAAVDVASFYANPQGGRELVIKVGGDDRARGFIDLPAGGAVKKELTFSSSGRGALYATARLSPDALAADNSRYFTARAGGRIRTLVVDGDPRPERYGAESYYLMNALNPRLEARSRVEPTLMTVAEFEKSQFKDYDLIILANVGSLRGKAVVRLKEYVEAGGAVLFAMGDRVDPGGFRSSFGDLAPADLFVLKEPTDPEGIHLDPFKDDHPASALFRRAGRGDLSLARFHKYFLIDRTNAPGNLRAVLSFTDGAPALVERPIGRGKVALFASTLDRDWNDLCIYPTYLPVLQQLALYMTGGLYSTAGKGAMAGDVYRFACPSNAIKALVRSPDGEKLTAPVATAGDGRTGEFKMNKGPGFYDIYCLSENNSGIKEDSKPDIVVAANVDAAESDLARWETDELENKLEELGVKHYSVATDVSALASSGNFAEGRREIWPAILAMLVGVILLEGLLTWNG